MGTAGPSDSGFSARDSTDTYTRFILVTTIVCGSGFGIGIWGVISPEQTGLSKIVAIPVMLVSAFLLVYLLNFRSVVLVHI